MRKVKKKGAYDTGLGRRKRAGVKQEVRGVERGKNYNKRAGVYVEKGQGCREKAGLYVGREQGLYKRRQGCRKKGGVQ